MTTTARPLQKVKYLQLTQLTPAHDAPQPAGEVDKPAAPLDEPRTGSYFPQLSRNARLMFWYVVISLWRARLQPLGGAMCSRAAAAWAWFVITLALLGVSRFTIVFYTCRGVWMTTLFRYVRHAGQSVRCCAAWRSRRCTCRRSTYLFRTGGGSNKLVGVAFGAEAIAEVVAAPVSGWATDRFRRDKVLKLSAFIGLLGTGFAVVGFATESTIVCVVGLVCWGVFRGESRAANSQPLVYRNHCCTAITASRVWSVALGTVIARH